MTARSRRCALLATLAMVTAGLTACSGNVTGLPGDGLDGGTPTDSGPFTIDGLIGPACAQSSQQVTLRPLDMLIALDTSESMGHSGKWPAVKGALVAFTENPGSASLGMALQYFPLRKACNVDEYRVPAVPFGILPGVAADIKDSLEAQRTSGGTPMVPVLEGVLPYARERAEANPDRKVIVVLATDGIPDNTCLAPDMEGGGTLGNSLENVVTVAASGLSGSPSILTFVIGVGSELSELNQIAAGGGTENALLVDTGEDIESAFFAALKEIREKAVFCQFDVPKPEDVALNFERVNVQYTLDDHSETFVNVGDSSRCADAPYPGWYYDNPDAPNQIKLCDAACNKLRGHLGGKIDILYGCKIIVY